MYGGWPWGRRGVGFCKILARISSRFSSMKTNKGVLVYRYLFEWGIPPFGLMLFSVWLHLCNQPATIGQLKYSHFQEVPLFGIKPFGITVIYHYICETLCQMGYSPYFRGIEFCFGIPTWREMIPSEQSRMQFLTLP